MDIFKEVTSWVKNTNHFHQWPEMFSLFKQQASGEPFGWDLGVSACLAIGGDPKDAVPLVAAYGCILNSILMIDDILDHDPKGLHHKLGIEKTTNIAAAFQSAGLSMLNHVDMPLVKKYAVVNKLNQMIYDTALGQALDVEIPNTEKAYWRVVRGKSSPYHSAVIYCGAIFGGASLELAEKMGSFGSLYGEIIQIHDDLKDTMDKEISVDWLYRKMTLPILFANIVEYPEKERFLELQENISAKGNLEEAQEILLRCGALSYSLEQLLQRHRKLVQQLDSIPLKKKHIIIKLIDRIIHPFVAVMEKIGFDENEINKIISDN